MADSIQDVANRHRRALLNGQRQASEELARSYATVWQSISTDLDQLQRRIQAAAQAGEPISEAALQREERYRTLLLRIEAQLLDLAPQVAGIVDQVVKDATASAILHTDDLLTLGPDGFAYIDSAAAVQITATTERGPLEQLLRARAGNHTQAARDVLREAVIRGWSPHKTARALKRVTTDAAFKNALTVARTEQLRAYREATRQRYQANPAVDRWVWSSRLIAGRTCPMCWAQHGQTFSLSKAMPTHPNCMCVMLPLLEDVDYGKTGEDRFADLTPDQQKAILGPSTFAAYDAGDLTLADLVSTRRHKEWGPVGTTRSLDAALGSKATAYKDQAAAAGRVKAAATRAANMKP